MEKDISKMTEEELNSLGYKLHETKEQLIAQVNQVNQSLLMIRSEKQKRIEKKFPKVKEKPEMKMTKTSKK